jgi:hypothetical protein
MLMSLCGVVLADILAQAVYYLISLIVGVLLFTASYPSRCVGSQMLLRYSPFLGLTLLFTEKSNGCIFHIKQRDPQAQAPTIYMGTGWASGGDGRLWP